ncbi:MAG TPA: outer membrane beta-barrel protein [Kofleriaceae bacterium]|jgi:OOP family OmpA-OmpF porin|nr:outer membrane beta-barrel protein [Kofleriaceae bacterium]
MKRVLLAAMIVAATSTVASAGTYVGLGIGTAPATSGDAALDENGRSLRAQLGYSFGHFAVEGVVNHANLDGTPWGYTSPGDMSWTTLGVAAKYNIPLGDKFEGFGRLGVQRTFLSIENDPKFGSDDWAGSGLFGGGGFEYKMNLIAAGASIFVDYTIAHETLSSPKYMQETYGLTSRVWTLGATVSF